MKFNFKIIIKDKLPPASNKDRTRRGWRKAVFLNRNIEQVLHRIAYSRQQQL